MTAVVSALDSFTSAQYGENGHSEYRWSNSIREQIIQLSFQLTRTQNMDILHAKTDHIISDLKQLMRMGEIQKEVFVEYMSLLFKMIAHTRDIIDGKGEYALSYMLLSVWEKHYPDLAQFAFHRFFLSDQSHPYGSWKDVKGYSKYAPKDSIVLRYGMRMLNEQLRQDETSQGPPSLAARWVPREKSAFGYLFTELATNYFSEYIASAKTDLAKKNAILKAKTQYRKLISGLNRQLDTVQIKQCEQEWSKIDPANQTSITMNRQRKAFLNLDKKGNPRTFEEDRVECAKSFNEYIQRAVKGEVQIKGKRVGLNDMVKDALHIRDTTSVEAQLLNAQWLDSSKSTGSLGKMIPMCDVSGSMDGDPLHAAIGLSLRCAEKSLLGKRIMTFSASPQWINLTGVTDFVDMVQDVKCANWGMNTNFYSALTMILNAIVTQKLKHEDVEDMILVVFSDMQIDQADKSSMSMYMQIETQYSEAGVELWGKPFKPPHILFWNLRSTSGFPTLSTQKNTSMMSGFSPALLNLFCEQGMDALHSCTPWSLFTKSLENERYKVLDAKIREYFA